MLVRKVPGKRVDEALAHPFDACAHCKDLGEPPLRSSERVGVVHGRHFSSERIERPRRLLWHALTDPHDVPLCASGEPQQRSLSVVRTVLSANPSPVGKGEERRRLNHEQVDVAGHVEAVLPPDFFPAALTRPSMIKADPP